MRLKPSAKDLLKEEGRGNLNLSFYQIGFHSVTEETWDCLLEENLGISEIYMKMAATMKE